MDDPADVSDARKFLNFTKWAEYGTEGQQQLLSVAADKVEQQQYLRAGTPLFTRKPD